MSTINFNKKFESFNDWGSWGVGDFYEDPLKILRGAVASGKPFDSGWHSWKKELQSMRIVRDDVSTTIEVSEYMDDPYGDHELLGDFLEDDEWEKLDDETLETLNEKFYEHDVVDEVQDEYSGLPRNATFNEIIEKARELMKGCSERLNEAFRNCIALTLLQIYGESDETEKRIEERIKKCCNEDEEDTNKDEQED